MIQELDLRVIVDLCVPFDRLITLHKLIKKVKLNFQPLFLKRC